MKLGLSSLLFTCERLERAIEAAASLSYQAVEIVYDMPHFMPGRKEPDLRRLRGLLEDASLAVSVHSSFWDLNPASYYPTLQRLSVKRVKRSARVCKELGGQVLVVHPGKCPAPDARWVREGTAKLYREFLREVVPYAKNMGVEPCLENGNSRENPYSLLPELGELVEAEGIGMTLDIPHAFLRYGSRKVREIVRDVRRVGSLIRHVHIHDSMGHRDEHLVPGEGRLRLEPVVECLKEAGFSEIVVAELWDPKNPWDTARRARKSLRNLLG
ncbi:MAG: sugar phosphate isomerase/epimerase [Candidatus Hadarchaeales archaeon]